MSLFPFMGMIVTLMSVYDFFAVFRVSSRWMLLPVLLLGVVNVAGYDGHYLYQGYDRQLEVAKTYAGLPCIALYDGTGYYYNLLEFTEDQETLLLRIEELEERADTADFAQRQQVVVLRKQIVDEAEALDALRRYGWEVEEVLMEEGESVYGDTIYLCSRMEET